MTNITMEKNSMRDAYGEEIARLSEIDPRVYALDGDLANSTKINTVEERCPEKFLQMGIAEQNMVGVASGLATVGLQPWVTTFAAFLTKRSLDQVQVVVAQPKLDVKLIGAYGGLLNGRAGKTHQAIEDIAIMRSLVNMTVLAPGDTVELRQMLRHINEFNGPVYLRMARDPVLSLFDESYEYTGKAVKLREGTDITIISTGTQTGRAIQAAEQLEQQKISAAVLHVPSIKPLDAEAIIDAARATGAVVTAEDHSIYGGLGSAVAEVIVEHHPVPVLRVGIDDKNIQAGSNEELLDRYGLSANHIVQKVQECLKKKKEGLRL